VPETSTGAVLVSEPPKRLLPLYCVLRTEAVCSSIFLADSVTLAASVLEALVALVSSARNWVARSAIEFTAEYISWILLLVSVAASI
jgi:hypothetical protein